MQWSINDMDIFTFLISTGESHNLIEAIKLLEKRGMAKKAACEYVEDYRKILHRKD